MKIRLAVHCFLILAALIGAEAHADCVKDPYGNVLCGKGVCAANQRGKIFCAREGGGAVVDSNGNVKCGIGYCATDNAGKVKCSPRRSGDAEVDSNGKVNCVGGCKDGSPQFCEPGRPTQP